jgi:hypothetical protein
MDRPQLIRQVGVHKIEKALKALEQLPAGMEWTVETFAPSESVEVTVSVLKTGWPDQYQLVTRTATIATEAIDIDDYLK